ncbi:AMP-binding protein [Cupriavidus metallidurans]|uniref:AMP-binding protein n=1 Tax=Cupriavidus metallidurans TaxID=119219 RepID=UPI001649263F|nr:AMP-binding protein [Cupriavidus metallidurans]
MQHHSPHASGVPVGTMPRYRDAALRTSQAVHEMRPDGTLLLRAGTTPVPTTHLGFSGFVADWSRRRGAQTALAQRDSAGAWRALTWGDFHRQMLAVAAGLLQMGLSRQRPLMILSGNSIEHALVVAAAEYVGIPCAAASAAYSLQSKDFARLKDIHGLLAPAAVFVQSAEGFGRALDALAMPAHSVIAVEGAGAGHMPWESLLATELTPQRLSQVEVAHGAVLPEHIARIFFTSGSTGVPKGVQISYASIQALIGQFLFAHAAPVYQGAVVLDWLPWSHVFGGVGNLGRAFVLGASYYIDDGRPVAGQFARTLQNLREVSPTMFATVPAAWAMLVTELERDEALARAFFARLMFVSFGGASLPADVYARFQRLAERTVGERILFTSGFGATETTAMGLNFSRPTEETGNLGMPAPGVEVKLVPLDGGDGRYEIRMRGRNLFSGYLGRPDLTAAAFDDEGFYCMGDAVRLAEPDVPTEGLRYAGRCVEDFKLVSGTWVRTGAVRVGLLEQCAPLLTDAVICGHDRNFVTAMAWPNVVACQALAPELAGLRAEALVSHPLVVQTLQQKLRSGAGGATSQQVRRVLLMAEPPSIDANEVADKGYINQATTRERRKALIEALYQEPVPAAVASMG